MAKRKLDSQEKEHFEKELIRLNLFWEQIKTLDASSFSYDWIGTINDLRAATNRLEQILIDEQRFQDSINQQVSSTSYFKTEGF